MDGEANTTVRMFGALHDFRKERGLEAKTMVFIPPEGRTAGDVAGELGLPIDKIEGVFVNHVVYDLGHLIRPGDRVAFISTGVPGPHRFLLGIYGAGKADR